MSRRSLLITTLLGAVLLPATAVAQGAAEPAASPSPATPVIEASASPLASPLASPSPSAEPLATAEPVEPTVEVAAIPEPDFLVGEWEIRKVPWKHLRLNNGPVLPAETVGPHDRKGIPKRALGPKGKLIYNPTVVAQQGMKRLDSYVQSGNKLHLRQARKYADALERMSDGGKKRRWQPHWYDLGVHESGWVNSNSHGLMLSFLSRYYRVTGAEQKLEEAELLLKAFLQRPDNQRWFTDVTNGGYVWFEHWPNGRNDRTLNAHLNALFGLYDYWHATGSPLAEQYFLGGVKTVRDKLYRFRRKGELSRYSLASTEGSLHYHETHVDQLRLLARMTGDKWFARQADRFVQDELAWKAKYRGRGR